MRMVYDAQHANGVIMLMVHNMLIMLMEGLRALESHSTPSVRSTSRR